MRSCGEILIGTNKQGPLSHQTVLDSGTQQSSVIEEKDCEYERVKSELIEKPKYLHGYEELKIPNGTLVFFHLSILFSVTLRN